MCVVGWLVVMSRKGKNEKQIIRHSILLNNVRTTIINIRILYVWVSHLMDLLKEYEVLIELINDKITYIKKTNELDNEQYINDLYEIKNEVKYMIEQLERY